MQTDKNVNPLLYKSYVAAVRNSENSNIFRSLYAAVDGKKLDVLRDGDLSCAYFVSSLLRMFGLIRKTHATVKNTIKDLEESGWIAIDKPKAGSVLVWEKKVFDNDEIHEHIGFYLEENKAISNSETYKVPRIHNITWGNDENGKPIRKIDAIYWNEKLTSEDK